MQTRIVAKPARRCHDIVVQHKSGDEEVLATATVVHGSVTLDSDIVVGRSGDRTAGIVMTVHAADAKDLEVAISGLCAMRDILAMEKAQEQK